MTWIHFSDYIDVGCAYWTQVCCFLNRVPRDQGLRGMRPVYPKYGVIHVDACFIYL